jgi:hypothetical protein
VGTRINITGYKKGFLRCALLFTVGAALQYLIGNASGTFLKHPWGAVIAVNYLYILILAYSKSAQWKWIKSIYDSFAMTASLASMTILCVIFGLCRQDGSTSGVFGVLGFHMMRSSWPFLLLLLDFITILGLRSIDDIHHWRSRRHIPVIIHCAVFIILAAGLFSSSDKQRLRVIAPIGHPVNVAVDDNGRQHTLPFTITLRKFSIEEYPPKIYMIDPAKGSSSKEFMSLEKGTTEGLIENWKIDILEYIDSAGKVNDSDTYMAMNHVGATSAVLVKATGPDGDQALGWISCGSHIFPASILTLDSTHALVMPPREAALYLSDVKIERSKGVREHEIRVNHPASIGPWKIYQVSYDKERGKWSTISILECVKDGWYPIVQVALWIILASGAAMAFSAGLRNKRKEGMS